MESLEAQGFVNTERLRLGGGGGEEEVQRLSTPSLEDTTPFLQMLQSEESQPFLPFKEPNFLALLSLQHLKKPWELENNATHEAVAFHSQVKYETSGLHQNPISNSCMDGVNSEPIQELFIHPTENMVREANTGCSSPQCRTKSRIKRKEARLPETITKERRKRKRTKAVKNKEEVENQRMTHIVVERNRRRQMNEHLNSLRFLTPPSYIQRDDQASIIGGAIDFVKQLEQLLQSLEARKRRRQNICEEESKEIGSACDSLRGISSNQLCPSSAQNEEKASIPRIEVTVIQNHVNIKVHCPGKHGQLLKAVVSLEELKLTVLHLNVASSDASMFYSFNLKMEDDCKLRLADDIAAAVHQIFNLIDD